MDAIDRAQQDSEVYERAALLAHRLKNNSQLFFGSGICEDCGRRIPRERLLAVPGVKRCVNCQKAEEQKA